MKTLKQKILILSIVAFSCGATIQADVVKDAETYVRSFSDFYNLIPKETRDTKQFLEFTDLAGRISPAIEFVRNNATTTPPSVVLINALLECETAKRNIELMLTSIHSQQALTKEQNKNFETMIARIKRTLLSQAEKIKDTTFTTTSFFRTNTNAEKNAAKKVLLSLIDALTKANTRTEFIWKLKRNIREVPSKPTKEQPVTTLPTLPIPTPTEPEVTTQAPPTPTESPTTTQPEPTPEVTTLTPPPTNPAQPTQPTPPAISIPVLPPPPTPRQKPATPQPTDQITTQPVPTPGETPAAEQPNQQPTEPDMSTLPTPSEPQPDQPTTQQPQPDQPVVTTQPDLSTGQPVTALPDQPSAEPDLSTGQPTKPTKPKPDKPKPTKPTKPKPAKPSKPETPEIGINLPPTESPSTQQPKAPKTPKPEKPPKTPKPSKPKPSDTSGPTMGTMPVLDNDPLNKKGTTEKYKPKKK